MQLYYGIDAVAQELSSTRGVKNTNYVELQIFYPVIGALIDLPLDYARFVCVLVTLEHLTDILLFPIAVEFTYAASSSLRSRKTNNPATFRKRAISKHYAQP